jgi:hypothetical protein
MEGLTTNIRVGINPENRASIPSSLIILFKVWMVLFLEAVGSLPCNVILTLSTHIGFVAIAVTTPVIYRVINDHKWISPAADATNRFHKSDIVPTGK